MGLLAEVAEMPPGTEQRARVRCENASRPGAVKEEKVAAGAAPATRRPGPAPLNRRNAEGSARLRRRRQWRHPGSPCARLRGACDRRRWLGRRRRAGIRAPRALHVPGGGSPNAAIVGTSMERLPVAWFWSTDPPIDLWREALDRGMIPSVQTIGQAPDAHVARRIRNRVVISFAMNRSTILESAALEQALAVFRLRTCRSAIFRSDWWWWRPYLRRGGMYQRGGANGSLLPVRFRGGGDRRQAVDGRGRRRDPDRRRRQARAGRWSLSTYRWTCRPWGRDLTWFSTP